MMLPPTPGQAPALSFSLAPSEEKEAQNAWPMPLLAPEIMHGRSRYHCAAPFALPIILKLPHRCAER